MIENDHSIDIYAYIHTLMNLFKSLRMDICMYNNEINLFDMIKRYEMEGLKI